MIEKIKTVDLIKMYTSLLKFDISPEFNNIREIGFYRCLESDCMFFYPPVCGSEEFYEKMQGTPGYYLDNKEEYDYTGRFIKPSDSLLEIGCGVGAFAKKISVKDYCGLEFSRKAKEIGSKNGVFILHQSVEKHSAENLSKYDVVCAFQVLEHVSNIRTFIESCILCLKPDGKLIFSVPSADSFMSLASNIITNMPPHHVSWWSDRCLFNLSKIFGIRLLSIEHEKLAEKNKELYAFTLTMEALKNIAGFRSKSSLLDQSLRYKILSYFCGIGSKLLCRGLLDRKLLPDGHSVVAVYEK